VVDDGEGNENRESRAPKATSLASRPHPFNEKPIGHVLKILSALI